MGKTALIVEGGGMKCAYSAGVLDAFLDNDISFDYCIGADVYKRQQHTNHTDAERESGNSFEIDHSFYFPFPPCRIPVCLCFVVLCKLLHTFSKGGKVH